MARTNGFGEQQDVVIRKDGNGDTETLLDVSVTEREYYVDVQITSTILEEGESYSISITSAGQEWYRDKIYVTSQNNYTIKHKLAQPSYTEYNSVDDNTYIV